MAGHTGVGVGYNVQLAVDAKHKLIVEQAVTNQVVDMGLLTQTAAPARDILGVEQIDVVADRGYFKAEDIEACGRPRVEMQFRVRCYRNPFYDAASSTVRSAALEAEYQSLWSAIVG